MGILDDAIREHLELKRQHGAADSDIDRLEKEAFGPAARPGDPGYETGESPLPSIEGESSEEAPTTVAPAAGQSVEEEPEASAPSADPGSPGPSEPEGSAEPPEEPEAAAEPIEAPEAGIFDVEDGELDVESMNTEDFAAAAGGGVEPSPAEVARQEHPHLDDTIDHPAPELTSLSDELEAAAPPLVDDPDSDEHEAPKPIEPRPAAREDEGEPDVTQVRGEGDSSDEDDDDPDDEGDSGEESSDDADLLEETPEFLKDAPEGEDLWFEQGPPKDFDFD